MKKRYIVVAGLLTGIIIISCSSGNPKNKMKYCGYELSKSEFIEVGKKIDAQDSVYKADSIWNIYDQINDSIRTAMPDTIEFEIFLSLLNKDEVGIDIYVPKNKKYFEIIGCTIMNANYKGKMPSQRYMCLYTYTNPDGSGETPFGVAIKRIK
jgi:hypothetical protein